jgi:hypothetical protein
MSLASFLATLLVVATNSPTSLSAGAWQLSNSSEAVLYIGYSEVPEGLHSDATNGKLLLGDERYLNRHYVRVLELDGAIALVPRNLYGLDLFEFLAYLGSTFPSEGKLRSLEVDTSKLPPTHRSALLGSLRHAAQQVLPKTQHSAFVKEPDQQVSFVLNLSLHFKKPFPKRGDTLDTFLMFSEPSRPTGTASGQETPVEIPQVDRIEHDQFALKFSMLRGRTYPEEYYGFVTEAAEQLKNLQAQLRLESDIAMRRLVQALTDNAESKWGRRVDPAATLFTMLDPKLKNHLVDTYGRNPSAFGFGSKTEFTDFLETASLDKHRYSLSVAIRSGTGRDKVVTLLPLDSLLEWAR